MKDKLGILSRRVYKQVARQGKRVLSSVGKYWIHQYYHKAGPVIAGIKYNWVAGNGKMLYG